MKFESGFVIKCLHQSQSLVDLHRVGLLTEVQVGCLTSKFKGVWFVFEVLLGLLLVFFSLFFLRCILS